MGPEGRHLRGIYFFCVQTPLFHLCLSWAAFGHTGFTHSLLYWPVSRCEKSKGQLQTQSRLTNQGGCGGRRLGSAGSGGSIAHAIFGTKRNFPSNILSLHGLTSNVCCAFFIFFWHQCVPIIFHQGCLPTIERSIRFLTTSRF